MQRVNFVENAYSEVLATFAGHYGLLYFFDQLIMDKRDSDGFFSRRLVCRTSDNSI